MLMLRVCESGGCERDTLYSNARRGCQLSNKHASCSLNTYAFGKVIWHSPVAIDVPGLLCEQ